MEKTKWIVQSWFTTREECEKYCKEKDNDPDDWDIEDFQEIEISVVREDNKHGQESYGWEDMDKIVLFDEFDHEVTQKDMDWYQKVAKVMCDALNREKL